RTRLAPSQSPRAPSSSRRCSQGSWGLSPRLGATPVDGGLAGELAVLRGAGFETLAGGPRTGFGALGLGAALGLAGALGAPLRLGAALASATGSMLGSRGCRTVAALGAAAGDRSAEP